MTTTRTRKRIMVLVVVTPVALLILSLTAIELTLNHFLNNPASCPADLLPSIRRYYAERDCDVFQYNPGFTRYDEQLFYAMRPGRFVFTNREFSNVFEINSAGFRDNEPSLSNPPIIVLGDSYAMGWGVEQHETFAALLEKRLAMTVLNMGVSSYGTAREVAALARVQTDGMKYLVIQYCPNDLNENSAFVNSQALPVSSATAFDEASEYNRSNTAYFPFKHVFSIAGGLLAGERRLLETKPERLDPAIAFLSILEHSDDIPRDARIIVFSLEAERSDASFITAVADRLNRDSSFSIRDRLSLVDLTGAIEKRHRHILDPHLNRSGHRVVANRLARHIRDLDHLTRTHR